MNQGNFNLEQIFSPSRCISAELLLKYENNELNDKEARNVELHLVDCPLCEDALAGIALTGSEEFSDLLSDVNAAIEARATESRVETEPKVIEFRSETVPASTPAKSNNWSRYFSVAASVVLLVTAGFFFLRSPVTPENIAAEYFQVFELGHTRSMESVSANVYDEAKSLYKAKRFAEAAPLFDQVDSIQSLYSAANCYYMIGKYDLAADRFQNVIAKSDGYSEDAEFSLAMTYLMQNKITDARALLKNMAQDDRHNYTIMAEKALKKVQDL